MRKLHFYQQVIGSVPDEGPVLRLDKRGSIKMQKSGVTADYQVVRYPRDICDDEARMVERVAVSTAFGRPQIPRREQGHVVSSLQHIFTGQRGSVHKYFVCVWDWKGEGDNKDVMEACMYV